MATHHVRRGLPLEVTKTGIPTAVVTQTGIPRVQSKALAEARLMRPKREAAEQDEFLSSFRTPFLKQPTAFCGRRLPRPRCLVTSDEPLEQCTATSAMCIVLIASLRAVDHVLVDHVQSSFSRLDGATVMREAWLVP